jgi:hypothetical protein
VYVCMYVLYNMKQEKKQKKNQIELFISHFIYSEKEELREESECIKSIQVKLSRVESNQKKFKRKLTVG